MTVLVVAPVESVAQVVVVGIEVVVHASLPESLAPLLGVEHLHAAGIHRGGDAGVEVDTHLAVLTLLRGDDDHTVGGARTVDRCRGGILQHLNRLNVVSVQLVHTGLRGHTVDDIKRVVVVQRTVTTDTHGSGTRGITVGRDVHARHTTLHGLDGVVFILLSQLRSVDHRDSAGQVGLALGLVTGHHHFVQLCGVVFHGHLHAGGCSHLLFLETDVREDEDGSWLHLQLEVTVEVGDGSVGRAFLHDGSTDNGLASDIDHGTCDFRLRAHERCTRNHEH